MIARELDRVLRRLRARRPPGVAARGRRAVPLERQRGYRRACWEEIRFRDVAVLRGPGVRPRRCSRRAGRRSTTRGAAVLHAHDYPPVEFMRRYFDEYRGLRETIGHVEPFGVRSTVRTCAGSSPPTARWMREQGCRTRDRAPLDARALVHHAGRKVLLGARLARRPAARRRCSARCRSSGARRRRRDRRRRRRRRARARARAARVRATSGACRARGRRRCSTPCPGMADRERAAHRGGHPAVPARQRRARPIFQPADAARGARAHRSRLAPRPDGLAARRRRGRRPGRHARVLRADRGPGVQGLRRAGTAPTSCSRPAGRRCYAVLRLDQCARARLPRARPRARVLRDVRRGAVGDADLRPRAVLHLRLAVAEGPDGRPLRRAGALVRVRRRPRRLPPAARRAPRATR